MEPLVKEFLGKAHSDRVIKDEATLPKEKQVQLINFLKENIEVFTWLLRDMPGIDSDIAQHHLNISLEDRPKN